MQKFTSHSEYPKSGILQVQINVKSQAKYRQKYLYIQVRNLKFFLYFLFSSFLSPAFFFCSETEASMDTQNFPEYTYKICR